MQTHPSAPRSSGNEADPQPLSILISRTDHDVVVVTPVGEADLSTVPGLRLAMDEATGSGRAHVIVDLGRLVFMDASFLGVLVEVRSRTSATGGTLQVRCGTEHGRRMLTLTGLDDLLEDHA